jgi:hypothetical protein
MKKLHYLILVAVLIIPSTTHAQFEGAAASARSTALGGMFTPMGDDPSTLLINCAGLVNSTVPVIYGDYSGSSDGGISGEMLVAAAYPGPWFNIGVGWHRRGLSDGTIENENVLIIGLARKILTNVGGSYLSVGAAVKMGRLSYGSMCECLASGSSETKVTGDVGAILRPLPVISIGYSMLTIREVDFEESSPALSWERGQRWGISYFWEERVIVGFEQQRRGGDESYHYGLAVRTSTPLEILAGFNDGDIQGGLRWVDEIIRVSVSFGSGEESGAYARASIELGLSRINEE